jgi:hypothetical protein
MVPRGYDRGLPGNALLGHSHVQSVEVLEEVVLPAVVLVGAPKTRCGWCWWIAATATWTAGEA